MSLRCDTSFRATFQFCIVCSFTPLYVRISHSKLVSFLVSLQLCTAELRELRWQEVKPSTWQVSFWRGCAEFERAAPAAAPFSSAPSVSSAIMGAVASVRLQQQPVCVVYKPFGPPQ